MSQWEPAAGWIYVIMNCGLSGLSCVMSSIVQSYMFRGQRSFWCDGSTSGTSGSSCHLLWNVYMKRKIVTALKKHWKNTLHLLYVSCIFSKHPQPMFEAIALDCFSDIIVQQPYLHIKHLSTWSESLAETKNTTQLFTSYTKAGNSLLRMNNTMHHVVTLKTKGIISFCSCSVSDHCGFNSLRVTGGGQL